MIRVVNMHTAKVEGIRPGHAGEVDPERAPVKVAMTATPPRLVPEEAVLASRQAALEAGRMPTRAELEAMVAELARRAAHIADLERQLEAAGKGVRVDVDMTALRAQLSAEMDAHVALAARDLGAQLAEKTEALAARDATIAALQKRVADLEADLASATEPKGTGGAADTTTDPKAATRGAAQRQR